NISISVDKNTVEEIKNKGSFLLFKDEKGEKRISIDLFDIKEDDGSILNQDFEDIKELVDSKYIFSKEVVDIILRGFDSNKNILLYGRGGHGKSEITELVLKELKNKKLIT